jgi:hypothetical protein
MTCRDGCGDEQLREQVRGLWRSGMNRLPVLMVRDFNPHVSVLLMPAGERGRRALSIEESANCWG